MLIALKQPLRASWILLARSSLWTYFWIAAALTSSAAATLEAIWISWLAGGLLALGLAVRWIFVPCVRQPRTPRIDWRWIGKGTRTALPFLISAACIWGAFTVDRYLLAAYRGEEQVGVYTFFFSISRVMLLLVEAGVAAVLLPRIVETFRRDPSAYRRHMRHFAIAAALALVVIGSSSPWWSRIVLLLVDRPIYSAHQQVLWILLAAMALYVASLLPHYGLYVRRADRAIAAGGAVLLGATVGFGLALIPRWGVMGGAWAMLIAMGAMCITKTTLCLCISRSKDG